MVSFQEAQTKYYEPQNFVYVESHVYWAGMRMKENQFKLQMHWIWKVGEE